MADREYIRPPQKVDFGDISESAFRYYQQVAQVLNELKTDLQGMSTYADNAAAVAGGLSVGEIYNTATGEVRIVV